MGKPFVGSFSALNTYKSTCPHQFFRRYIKKDQKYVESPEMAFGNAVHSAFEYRIGGNKPLPLEMQKWEEYAVPFDGLGAITEQKIGMTREGLPVDFFGDGVWFRGKIDVTVIQGTRAYIHDWKTGNDKYEDRFELDTCAMLLHTIHPELTSIHGSYGWLKQNRISDLYDLSDTQSTYEEVAELMDAIAADTVFEKRKSPLCPWCSVTDCENWVPRK